MLTGHVIINDVICSGKRVIDVPVHIWWEALSLAFILHLAWERRQRTRTCAIAGGTPTLPGEQRALEGEKLPLMHV